MWSIYSDALAVDDDTDVDSLDGEETVSLKIQAPLEEYSVKLDKKETKRQNKLYFEKDKANLIQRAEAQRNDIPIFTNQYQEFFFIFTS